MVETKQISSHSSSVGESSVYTIIRDSSLGSKDSDEMICRSWIIRIQGICFSGLNKL